MDNIVNLSDVKLKKEAGIELFSFQQIKDMNITFTKEDQLSDMAVLSIKSKIEEKDSEYIPFNIVLKRQGKKIVVIEGKHNIQAINEVKQQCKNWNNRVIPVRWYLSGEIL